MIRLLRVDHRLLHGQVAFSWTAALDADCILIANDSVVGDEVRKTTMKLSKPSGVKLVIKNIEDSIAAINSGVTDKYKLFIVVESVKDAKRLADACESVKSVNLGGVKKREDAKQISAAVYVTEEEVRTLREMMENGVKVEIRQVPSDSSVDAGKVL